MLFSLMPSWEDVTKWRYREEYRAFQRQLFEQETRSYNGLI